MEMRKRKRWWEAEEWGGGYFLLRLLKIRCLRIEDVGRWEEYGLCLKDITQEQTLGCWLCLFGEATKQTKGWWGTAEHCAVPWHVSLCAFYKNHTTDAGPNAFSEFNLHWRSSCIQFRSV